MNIPKATNVVGGLFCAVIRCARSWGLFLLSFYLMKDMVFFSSFKKLSASRSKYLMFLIFDFFFFNIIFFQALLEAMLIGTFLIFL